MSTRPAVFPIGAILALTTVVGHSPLWAQAQAPAEIYILATLYQRHATTPAYSHDSLRQIVQRIKPDVVVLDVSPNELQAQTVHPSKAEYPEVIFPLVRSEQIRAYPGEPPEPVFSEIVSQLGAELKRFQAESPASAAADRAYTTASYAALAELWRSPADVNGRVTDALLHARRGYQDRLAGAKVAEAWQRWNDHAAGMVRTAATEHPGKRVLVLIGVENCGLLRATLKEDSRIRLVDMEAWLRRGA
jgi:hypothetical protein